MNKVKKFYGINEVNEFLEDTNNQPISLTVEHELVYDGLRYHLQIRYVLMYKELANE